MNALLLPIVLGFLFLLARGLPQPWRLQGWYAWLSGGLIAVTTIFGVYSGLTGPVGVGGAARLDFRRSPTMLPRDWRRRGFPRALFHFSGAWRR